MDHDRFRNVMGSHLPFSEKQPRTPCPDGLRPFLGLGPRLLLTSLSPALLPLISTIIHLAATRSSTEKLAATLKDKVMAACNGIASGASSLQVLPRYMAMQTNREVLRATRAVALSVGTLLMDCLTIIEKVVGFILDMYRSLLLCTIQLIVQATMEFVISAVDKVKDGIVWMRTALQGIVETGNRLLEVANRLPGVNIDSMNVSALDQLEERLLPTAFQQSLSKLNASIPTLDDFRNLTDQLIAIPFNELRAEINATRLQIAANLNDSIFPPPSLQQLNAQDASALQKELCSDLDTSVIDNTAKALYNLGTAGIVALCLIVVAGFAILAFWQWMEWKAIKAAVENIENTPNSSPWTIVAVIENPVAEQRVRPVLDRLDISPRARDNARWLLSYLTHPTCLALLSMSLVGLIVIQVQIAVLHALERQARSDASLFVSASTAKLMEKIKTAADSVSREYALGMNEALASISNDINDKMFGQWINTTAAQLNETVVEFYDDLETLLNNTLGDTILHNPLNNFMYCVIGSKVDALEKGLAWIRAHAHVDLPLIPEDVLVLSDEALRELASPVAAAAVGAPTGSDMGALDHLIEHFEKALTSQRAMYAALLGVYGALLFAGLSAVAWNSGLRDRWHRFRTAHGTLDESSFGNGLASRHGASPLDAGSSFLDMGKRERGSSESLAELAYPGSRFLNLHSPPPDEHLCAPRPQQSHGWHSEKLNPAGEECLRAEGNGLWIDRAGSPVTSAFRGSKLGAMRGTHALSDKTAVPTEYSSRPFSRMQFSLTKEAESRPLPPPPRQVTPVETCDAVDGPPNPVQSNDPFSDTRIALSHDDTLPRVL